MIRDQITLQVVLFEEFKLDVHSRHLENCTRAQMVLRQLCTLNLRRAQLAIGQLSTCTDET